MKLPFKMAFCYLAAVLFMFLIVNLFGTGILRETIKDEIKTEYHSNALTLADEFAGYYMNATMSLSSVLKQLDAADTMIDARIWYVNNEGTVIADTRKLTPVTVNMSDMTFLNETYSEDVMLEGVFTEPMMILTEPVLVNYLVKGYVCVQVPMSMVETRLNDYLNIVNVCLLAGSVILLIFFAIMYLLIVYPARRIRSAALEYAKGNYEYPLKVKSHDEMRDLADAVSYMVGEIRNVDDYQKKFIANISHDFRSPLTSIKGYAEAMKDGTIPYEAQGKYLDIILFEADRLTKLTTNLLDLNRMDNNGVKLDITSFDINSVIRNTADAFEGICRRKKLVIELQFASEDTFVDADMGRVQQVLYNLTDNAIKFSLDSSKIDIETEEKGSKALIRVRDYGIGIPKDSIKKIWDRFYKSDLSRGKDKKGTGLGLSIVKEVISAHGENINVISTEGVGTEFTFTLPLSEEG